MLIGAYLVHPVQLEQTFKSRSQNAWPCPESPEHIWSEPFTSHETRRPAMRNRLPAWQKRRMIELTHNRFSFFLVITCVEERYHTAASPRSPSVPDRFLAYQSGPARKVGLKKGTHATTLTLRQGTRCKVDRHRKQRFMSVWHAKSRGKPELRNASPCLHLCARSWGKPPSSVLNLERRERWLESFLPVA